jgi:hypothetical protein
MPVAILFAVSVMSARALWLKVDAQEFRIVTLRRNAEQQVFENRRGFPTPTLSHNLAGAGSVRMARS